MNLSLSAMSLPRTSKDLKSCPSFLALRQNLDKNPNPFFSYSNNLVDFNNVNKKFLPKNSSQKNPPKKFLPKNSPKKFLPKNSWQKKINKKSKKCPNNFSKNS